MGTSYLSMMESRMPPGFRFHPRDEELISDYLAKKLSGDSMAVPMLVDVDLNKVEPWDLPGEACVGGKEWYFYSLRDRKYSTGQRTNRATISGYWKATGKDRPIVHEAGRGGRLVGMRKTLVFYQGRAPKGKKSDWVMHEFRAEPSPGGIATAGDHSHKRSSSSSTSKDWVLCRVFYKSRGLSMKPGCNNNNDHHHLASTSMAASASENCYDDTGSSSLPPLVDNTYINFEQPQHTTMQGLFNGQVHCFSSLLSSPHAPFPLLDNRQPMDTVRNELVSFSDLNPLMMGGLSGNQSRMEDGGRKPAMPPPEVSSESYLTEAGGQSMWASWVDGRCD